VNIHWITPLVKCTLRQIAINPSIFLGLDRAISWYLIALAREWSFHRKYITQVMFFSTLLLKGLHQDENQYGVSRQNFSNEKSQ
jgi:hypothetical protein